MVFLFLTLNMLLFAENQWILFDLNIGLKSLKSAVAVSSISVVPFLKKYTKFQSRFPLTWLKLQVKFAESIFDSCKGFYVAS